MTPARVVADLLGDWERWDGSLYERLAGALLRAVDRQELPPGTRLPAERSLAEALGISRSTVSQAYDLLRGHGWVESRQGSGTWVGQVPARSTAPVEPRPLPLSGGSMFKRLVEYGEGAPVNLATGALGDPQVLFDLVGNLQVDDLLRSSPPHGYAPMGLAALRHVVAERFTQQGAPTDSEQIIITTGAQQAIALLATHFVRPGDVVVTENPTYAGAIDAFSRAGAHLVGLPVDGEGIRLDALAEVLSNARPRLVYLMPTHHNPAGSVMPEEHRRALARLAEQGQVPIVEDNTLAELSLTDAPAPPPVASYEKAGNILSVGSMSKLFWSGLRVGWIRAPEGLVIRLAQHKVAADLGSSMVSQGLAYRLLAHLESVRRNRAGLLGERAGLLERLLSRTLPGWSWSTPGGGLALWVRLPGAEGKTFAAVALEHGVAVTPGAEFSVNEAFADHIRICFVAEPERLKLAVERLAAAWSAYGSAAPLHRAVHITV